MFQKTCNTNNNCLNQLVIPCSPVVSCGWMSLSVSHCRCSQWAGAAESSSPVQQTLFMNKREELSAWFGSSPNKAGHPGMLELMKWKKMTPMQSWFPLNCTRCATGIFPISSHYSEVKQALWMDVCRIGWSKHFRSFCRRQLIVLHSLSTLWLCEELVEEWS